MRTFARLIPVGFAVASLTLLACSAPPDTGSETRTNTSASVASPQPATPAACAKTLATWCASASCLETWSAADTVCMNATPTSGVSMSASCGGFFALQQSGGTAYYDATSTSLVAVVDSSGACLGGPSDFTIPAAESCGLTPCGPMGCGGGPSGPASDSGM